MFSAIIPISLLFLIQDGAQVQAAPREIISKNGELSTVSIPVRWLAPLNAAIVDFKKQFPNKVDCYVANVYEFDSQLFITFSSPKSGDRANIQGSNGFCGPDYSYRITLDGRIISRDTIQ